MTIPIAFEMAAKKPEDLSGAVRRRVRDEMASKHLLERMVRDIRFLLSDDDKLDDGNIDVTYLWDTQHGTVVNGKNYGDEGETSE